MEAPDNTTTSSSILPPPPPPRHAVLSPCAACKILCRRCSDDCILAPYFPPTESHNFMAVHHVFGASNVIKLLKGLTEEQRADAVSSMVYAAKSRIRDPVYGCTGVICQLQKQVNQLQTQLARSRAELVDLQAQHAKPLTAACMEMAAGSHQHVPQPLDISAANSPQIILQTEGSPLALLDNHNQSSLWDQLCGYEDSSCQLPHAHPSTNI